MSPILSYFNSSTQKKLHSKASIIIQVNLPVKQLQSATSTDGV